LIGVSKQAVAREEGNFDDWLSAELHQELAPHGLRPVPAPRYRFQARRRWRRLRLFAGPPAALGAKAATGLFVTAFAVAATGAAVTGSANPAVWGAHVRIAVADCKSALDRGQRSWGDCVSTVAGQLQPESPAPVIEAPSGTKAGSAPRIDDAQGPVVTAPPASKVVAPPSGKLVVPPRAVRATPSPDVDAQRNTRRGGGG
jgi:hypothetical protein